MAEISSIFHNQTLWVSLGACILAQIIKLFVELLQKGKVDVRFLFSTGGMPSAHSALVGALATEVGQVTGWESTEFAIAALFAVIVMYDAAGVRQAAGKQARILNQILDEMFEEGKDLNEERLKELLGHTPFQVLAGLILGITSSFLATGFL